MAAMPLKTAPNLDHLDADALRALAAELMGKVEQQAQTIHFKDTHIRKLMHEIAVLRRYRFGKRSEQLSGEQGLLLEDAVAADIAAIEQELDAAGADWQFVDFSGAVHCFAESDAQNPPGCVYHERSARRAYRMMADFFAEMFAK